MCVVPAWNEVRAIAGVVADVPRATVERTVVVDDGSTDGTASTAAAAGAVVVPSEGARGVGAAIRTGFHYALEHGFEVVVVLNGAGKTPPAQIPRLLEPIAAGTADLVYGSRYREGGEFTSMPWHRLLGTRAYTALFSLLCGRTVTDASCGFRAISATVLRDPRMHLDRRWLDRYELEPYLLFRAITIGLRVVEVPVSIHYPAARVPYTKMRAVVDWWRVFRPLLFLALRIRD
jgi:dolichol-phosphate mannosyltransferase